MEDEEQQVGPVSAPVTTYNRQNVPLLQLPVELRLQIYAYVILSREDSSTEKPETGSGSKDTTQKPSGKTHLEHVLRLRCATDARPFVEPYRNLLLICRQIYTEARLLPFQLATFDICTPRLNKIKPKMIQDQQRAVREICLLVRINADHLISPEKSEEISKEDTSILSTLSGLSGLRRVTVKLALPYTYHHKEWERRLAEEFVNGQVKEIRGNWVEFEVEFARWHRRGGATSFNIGQYS